MKAYRVFRVKAPRVLDLDIRWRWMVTITLFSLYPQGEKVKWISEAILT
jgi:hypothetical protein